MNFKHVATFPAKENSFRIHFWYMSKDEVENFEKNADLTERRGTL